MLWVTKPANLPYTALVYAWFPGVIVNSAPLLSNDSSWRINYNVVLFIPSQISLTSSVVEAFSHCFAQLSPWQPALSGLSPTAATATTFTQQTSTAPHLELSSCDLTSLTEVLLLILNHTVPENMNDTHTCTTWTHRQISIYREKTLTHEKWI